MCRFVAYLGQPITIGSLVCRPPRSLLQQSQHAAEAQMPMHGDGFGLGWYGQPAEPAVYRNTTPAWQSKQLQSLASRVQSGLFFAHVRAATEGPITRDNCHPFQLGRWLFMHNGQIGGWGALRRELEALLPDHLSEYREGSTDSELIFLLAMARMELGEDPMRAVIDVFDEIARRMKRARVVEPLRFCAALADGKVLYAFRLASDRHPPSLYLRSDDHGTVIASEPLDEDRSGWIRVPAGAVVRITRSAYLVQQVDDLALQQTAF
jgi:glutamine amidotransferase